MRRSPHRLTTLMPPRPNSRFDPVAAYLLRRPLARSQPALFHATDPYLVEYAPHDVPLLATVYDFIAEQHPGRQSDRFLRGFDVARRRPGTQFVTISETVAGDLRARGVSADAVTVLYPGPTRWPAPTRPPAAPVRRAIVIGALDPHKQPHHAIDAARGASTPIVFAGRHLPGSAEAMGLAPSEVASGLDDGALADLIRSSTCVIHASKAEGFGLPVLEAIALGTPVAAYDLPVTREIVGPDYPLVAPDSGPDGLADVLRAFADPDVRAAALTEAKPYADRFDWSRTRTLRDSLYARLVPGWAPDQSSRTDAN